MKKIILKILFLFTLCGCPSIYYSYNSDFSMCYKEGNTGLDSIINLNGYYRHASVYYGRTSYCNRLFYPNGVFIDYFDEVSFQEHKIKRNGFYNRGTLWGVYRLVNDTIIAQTMEAPGGMSWLKEDLAFKIIDSVTIMKLDFWKLNLPPNNEQKNLSVPKPYTHTVTEQILTGEFVPYSDLPDPNKSWIMKKKWFWCYEHEYKTWKKKHR